MLISNKDVFNESAVDIYSYGAMYVGGQYSFIHSVVCLTTGP
jgi:hypothetical protein